MAGISTSILQDTTVNIPSLHQERWLQTLRHHLKQSRLTLYIPDHRVPTSKRHHDQVLMDVVLKHSTYTIMEKIYLNRCRIYLKAETLSDLVNAAGTHILSDSYFCMEKGICPTQDLWPYQPRPGPKHREKWQQFLDEWCHTPTLTLKKPLGDWIADI